MREKVLSVIIGAYEDVGLVFMGSIPNFLNSCRIAKKKIIDALGGDTFDFPVSLVEDPGVVEHHLRYNFPAKLAKALEPFSLDEIVENKVKSGRYQGWRLSSYLAQTCGTDYVEDYSRLRQQIQAKGRIRISCAPEELLMISDNAKFTTCHSIRSDYAAANWDYAKDHHTLVAYYYQKEKTWRGVKLPFKLWRMLVYVDLENEAILFSRQYPTRRDILHRAVVGWFREKLSKIWGEIALTDGRFTVDADRAYIDRAYIEMWQSVRMEGTRAYIEIPASDVISADNMAECDYCRRLFPVEDLVSFRDGWLCRTCYKNEATTCDNCGEEMLKEDRFPVYGPGGEWVGVCEDCFENSVYFCERCQYGFLINPSSQYKANGVIYDDVGVFLETGEFFCNFCAERMLAVCDRCDRLVLKDEGEFIEERFVCNDCLEVEGEDRESQMAA